MYLSIVRQGQSDSFDFGLIGSLSYVCSHSLSFDVIGRWFLKLFFSFLTEIKVFLKFNIIPQYFISEKNLNPKQENSIEKNLKNLDFTCSTLIKVEKVINFNVFFKNFSKKNVISLIRVTNLYQVLTSFCR